MSRVEVFDFSLSWANQNLSLLDKIDLIYHINGNLVTLCPTE